jgi:gliding motility-associated-like protein
MSKTLRVSLLLLLSSIAGYNAQPLVRFEENKNQLPEQVLFKAEVPGGALFIENNKFTWHFSSSEAEGHYHGKHELHEEQILKGHAFQLELLGTNKNITLEKRHNFDTYSNYYLGKNPANWAKNVFSYGEVELQGIYQEIDWKIYSTAKNLKYDFIVKPFGNPENIRWKYNGVEDISIQKGKLVVKTTLGEIIEEAPVAFQEKNGVRTFVKCEFYVEKGVYGFKLGNYDKTQLLTIDPLLVFGSFSGSTADNWGFTATYDNSGNAYSAGISFGIGYPSTLGAYQTTFNGGTGSRPNDIGIIKYSPTGQKMWATYLGGTGNEIPQSLVVSSNNELFIFGTTGSSDFPTTSTAYNRTFNGGEQVSILRNGISFPNGTDIFISRLAENGNNLLASTLLGGSKNDGLILSSNLRYNYADEARGAIIIDNQNNIYVGCSTASENFQVPGNAFQTTFAGGPQDGIVVKMNANLSTLFWGSYLGGTGADGICSLTLDHLSNIYVCGATVSTDFPVTADAHQIINGGGQCDGFITGISPNGQQMLASTYYGAESYDQSYFVATNRAGEVYVYGQTEKGGNFYQNNFTYFENNGKQFVSKFSNNLGNRIWSTTFGNGSPKPNISPSAFTVDICGQVFMAGWGGSSNAGPDGAAFGGTIGMTVTPDAFQQTTDNNDFYLIVLNEPDKSLVYATFFGGANSSEHVDGGTSRFDKRGVIYQAVCAGCGGRDDFPTTPGVWSNTNGSISGCNNAIFKFDFQLPATVASFTSPPIGCAPYTVDFTNFSSNATSYEWKVNGSTFSTNENVSRTFTQAGLYTIQLIAQNPNSCNVLDTFTKQVRVVNSTRDIFDSLSVCYLTGVEIGPPFPVDPYYEVLWNPTLGLNEPTAQRPMATPPLSTNYILYLSLGSCADTIEQFIEVRLDQVDAGLDLSICRGQTVVIGNSGDSTLYDYEWTPVDFLNANNIAQPLASVDESTWFNLLRIPKDTANGCPGKDSLLVMIPEGSPLADFDVEMIASCTDVKVSITNKSELSQNNLWEFGEGMGEQDENPFVIYQYGDSVNITLMVNNLICRDTLSKSFPLKSLTEYFTINQSNAFSPNGDGKNDCFSPALQDLPAPDDKNFLKCSTLRIYDRWGKPIFESVETDNGCWNGTNENGAEMPDGTYFFMFEGQGKKIEGAVTLLRAE